MNCVDYSRRNDFAFFRSAQRRAQVSRGVGPAMSKCVCLQCFLIFYNWLSGRKLWSWQDMERIARARYNASIASVVVISPALLPALAKFWLKRSAISCCGLLGSMLRNRKKMLA